MCGVSFLCIYKELYTVMSGVHSKLKSFNAGKSGLNAIKCPFVKSLNDNRNPCESSWGRGVGGSVLHAYFKEDI